MPAYIRFHVIQLEINFFTFQIFRQIMVKQSYYGEAVNW